MLLHDFFDFQGREPLEAHLQNSLGLLFGELELLAQNALSRLRVRRCFDQRNDFVDIFQGDFQPLKDVGALPGLGQIVFRTADHDHVAEVQEVSQHLFERQHLGFAVHQRQKDHAVGILELRVLVEIVQHHLRNGIAFHFHHQADAILVRFIPNIADPFQFFGPNQLGDTLGDHRFVGLIGNLCYDDLLAVVADLFEGSLGPHDHLAAAGGIGRFNAFRAVDVGARGKVGSRDDLD